MAEESDYYSVLEISPSASEDEIRLAFRRLARRYHPDVAGTGDVARMQRLNVAYQTLSDPARRRAYDREQGIAPSATAQRTTAAPSAAPTARPRVGARSHSAGPLRHTATLTAPDTASVTALAFARNGLMIGTGLIDGRVLLWELPAGRLSATLTFGPRSPAGVLQELRLAPSGALAAAWGLLLGTRVWRVEGARPLWTAGVSGPSGSMDATLTDDPPLLQLALPDAPLALADADPFRWAHEGRHGTAIYTRPLVGPVAPKWAVPQRCAETASIRRPLHAQDLRVHQRVLALGGRRLLTLVTTRAAGKAPGGALHLWEMDHRSLLGGLGPRRIARAAFPAGVSWYPLAATPDLAWVATGHTDRALNLIAPRSGARCAVPTGPVPADARVALTPDGGLLALARGARLDLWRTPDGAHVQEWQFGAEIAALSFAAQAERPLLGIGLGNGLAEVWG
jgi:hypothetical protein